MACVNPIIVVFDVALLIGLVIISGKLAAKFKLPKVSGYLCAGILISPYVLTKIISPEIYSYFFPHEIEPIISFIKKIALGMIIFTIGGYFDSESFRRLGKRILIISAFEIGLSMLLIAGLLTPFIANPMAGIMLAIMGISTAPAATYMVLREYRSQGPVSSHILVLIGINTFVTIVLFRFGITIFDIGTSGVDFTSIIYFFLEIVIAIVIGLLTGIVVSYIERLIKTDWEFMILYISAIAGLIGIIALLNSRFNIQVSDLIAILVMGIIIANTSVKETRAFEVFHKVDHPIYAIFFILSGMKLKVNELAKPEFGLLIVLYIAGRTIGKLMGGILGVRFAGKKKSLKYYIGIGLLTQEGLAIGLNTILIEIYPDISSQVSTVIIASVVIFALIGPVFTRLSLVKSGEVKSLSIKKSAKKNAFLSRMIKKLILQLKLQKKHDSHKKDNPDDSEQILCEDIMRRSVEKISDTMKFDDVVMFASQCKYDIIPVIDDNDSLLGIISYSSIRGIVFDPAFAHVIIAGDIMDVDPVACYPRDTLIELLEKFQGLKEKLDYLPVINSEQDKTLIGIVTQSDVLLTLRDDQKQKK